MYYQFYLFINNMQFSLVTEYQHILNEE